MKIKKYSENDKIIWNEYVKLSKNFHFFFIRDYMDYHSERFKDHSLLIYNDSDKLIALLPGNIDGDVFNSHQGLTFGGLILKSSVKQTDVLKIFSAIKEYLKDVGVSKLIYKAIPGIYHKLPADEDLYALFIQDANLVRRDVSSAINLSEKIKYSKGRKWTLKKAKENGLLVSETDRIEEFWSELSGVLFNKHGVKPVHSFEEITSLKSKFPSNIRFHIVHKDNKIFAGSVIFTNNIVAHTQYLFNTEEGRELGALDFLVDELINKEYSGLKYFDFGISNEKQGRYLNEGLISQKEGFGGRAVVHDFYECKVND
ncbi:GNAT family N-acetyltransferase [Vibrio splendidus]|uniref:GNAT family N-acetyltransferase n=1 Tax=Vibrio splendidus TaxID=29497 RepID=UPI000D39FB94|nr:GNAT family N-acetyltransferase [Vibrio splendidus]PTP92706.1 GNAT family N-acetyltransferase [Vibrio splendidus]